MKDYYEILGVGVEATKDEIKRAYFRQVRKYPPDRFEEQFMTIREAYEILSNEKTKMQYDSMHSMSPFIKINFEQAKKLIEVDELGKAIKILEELIEYSPELNVIKVLLGETYRKNNNSGKAINIFQELVKEDPSNAGFAGHLSFSFLDRGWHKKAISAFKKAIKLDEDNISFYLGLSDAYHNNNDLNLARNILEDAIERFKDSSEENTSVYYNLIQMDVMVNDKERMINHLDALTKLAEINEDIKDNTAWTLAQLAKCLLSIFRIEESEEIIKRALLLSPGNADILEIQQDISNVGSIRSSFDLLKIDSRIDDNLKYLIEMEVYSDQVSNIDMMTKDARMSIVELRILENFDFFRNQIILLKTAYSDLYKVKREFFESALNTSKRRPMLKKRKAEEQKYNALMSMFNANSSFDEDDDDEDNEDEYYYSDDEEAYDEEFYKTEEPFVREEAKIGRNDPCPCGSGKKYKKCCGRA